MFLSYEDIKRIQDHGFSKDDFVFEENGWMVLKNIQGRCVFHNGKNCTIYTIRPEGCTLYPLIYDEEYHLSILDEVCPFKDKFVFHSECIEQLQNFVQQLRIERDNRIRRGD